MGYACMKISTENRSEIAEEFGIENALAQIVRRRWRAGTVCMVMAEYDLTEGQARGVVDATASRTTINKLLKHRRGGWRLFVPALALVIGHTLEQHVEERLRHEQEHYERATRDLRKMVADLPSVFGLDHSGQL